MRGNYDAAIEKAKAMDDFARGRDLKLASLRRGDRPLVEAARRVAESILAQDPSLHDAPHLADEVRLFVGEAEAAFLHKS